MQSKLWTISELATELNFDRRTLAKRLEGLAPEEQEQDSAGREHRRYRLAKVFAHFLEDSETGGLKLDDERARLAKEQADKFELDNAERRGDLARISVLTESFAEAVQTAQALLLAIPTKEARTLAAINDANAIEQRLRTSINDALRQLAAYGARGAKKRRRSNGEGDGVVRAAARPNGKSVGRGKQATQ